MNAVEFTADLTSEPILKLPPEVAARLPKSGVARVIVLTGDQEHLWHRWAAEQLNGAYGPDEPDYDVSDLKP